MKARPVSNVPRMGHSGGEPVARIVLTSIAIGLVVLLLIAGVGVAVLRRVATDQSFQEAEGLSSVSGRIVQPRIDDGLLTGDAASLIKMSTITTDAVLHDPIVAVRLYGPDGTVLYADDLEMIGNSSPTAAGILSSLGHGEVRTLHADPGVAESLHLAGDGPLLVSYVALATPKGTPLLMQIYQRFSSVADSRQHLLEAFAPVLLAALIAVALLFVPLAWILARRVRRATAEREEALRRSMEISEREQRRIAADLHDGPVQELAGLAMGLSANAERASTTEEQAAFADAADSVRGSIRTLRSAVVGVYPPNLQAAGLGPALHDLTARLPAEGLDVTLHVPPAITYGSEADALLYRACQEGLRNVQEHAGADRLILRVFCTDGRAVLEVQDDGRGFSGDDVAEARAEGHVGLLLLESVLHDGGGSLHVGPVDGGGTLLRAEVPV